MEKIYIKICYITLERLESQDLENQQRQFCKVGHPKNTLKIAKI